MAKFVIKGVASKKSVTAAGTPTTTETDFYKLVEADNAQKAAALVPIISLDELNTKITSVKEVPADLDGKSLEEVIPALTF